MADPTTLTTPMGTLLANLLGDSLTRFFSNPTVTVARALVPLAEVYLGDQLLPPTKTEGDNESLSDYEKTVLRRAARKAAYEGGEILAANCPAAAQTITPFGPNPDGAYPGLKLDYVVAAAKALTGRCATGSVQQQAQTQQAFSDAAPAQGDSGESTLRLPDGPQPARRIRNLAMRSRSDRGGRQ